MTDYLTFRGEWVWWLWIFPQDQNWFSSETKKSVFFNVTKIDRFKTARPDYLFFCILKFFHVNLYYSMQFGIRNLNESIPLSQKLNDRTLAQKGNY